MALAGFVGAESGGLEEIFAVTGAPTADASVKRTGEYSYKLAGTVVTAQQIQPIDTVAISTGDEWETGFAFRWNVNLIPTNDIDFWALGTGIGGGW